ncbi:MAG: protein kinase domain-containing protein, partial [Longimicrobiales bacterium]
MSQINRLNDALEGRYRVERELGEGGMATVYLADDIRHERKVALKVLKPELAAAIGAERFLREIKTTANLQHPNILPLFDSGEAAGFLFYVMPFVDGEALRVRLDRESQLPVDEAVEIATGVARALQAAHDFGVVHRDIKPANILLTGSQPVVADFGIALAVGPATGPRVTKTGLSLGTPDYMSPEQATAEKDVTPRTDTYSLGCVLYEMLTGEPPHVGSSARATIMKIVNEEPRRVSELRKSVPPNVVDATAKALEKVAADRFKSVARFAEALADPGFRWTLPVAGRERDVESRGTRGRVGPVAAAAIVAVAGAAIWGWARPAPSGPVVRNTIVLSDQVRMTEFALSPDGSSLAYIGSGPEGQQIFLKGSDEHRGEPLPGTEGASLPFFSPDGNWLGFIADEQLRKVLVTGGPSVLLADSAGRADVANRGGVWLSDRTLAFIHESWDLAR